MPSCRAVGVTDLAKTVEERVVFTTVTIMEQSVSPEMQPESAVRPCSGMVASWDITLASIHPA